MSRNLCRTDCGFCSGRVVLVGSPHLMTEGEAGRYFDEYRTMTVADAECEDCHGKYVAWVVPPFRGDWGSYGRYVDPEVGFFDLSYRRAFNDEPAPEDLPNVDPRIARAQRLRQMAVEMEDDAVHNPGWWEAYRR